MELSLLQIIMLAVVQGVTEFLPVSSSGHLVILAALLTQDGRVENLDVGDVNIVLHGGTLLSILVFYWKRIRRVLGEERRLIGLLIVATLPAVMAGLALEVSGADRLLSDPLLAGCMLPITGVLLIWASRHAEGSLACQSLTCTQAAAIGLSQAFAILPGISRSGSTIALGMRLGLMPGSAATFSFLMAIPVILGACVLQLLKMIQDDTPGTARDPRHLINLGIGAGVAFIVGLASLWILVRWLERGRFKYFAYWCIPVGVGVILWQLTVRGTT